MDKEKRKNQNTKPLNLPERYEPGFLERMDKRTEIYAALRSAYDEITNDLGGVDALGHVQTTIVERFVFLECILRNWERQIITNPKDSEKLLSRWIQALNSLSGLAKTIGIERKAKKIQNLKSYVEGKS